MFNYCLCYVSYTYEYDLVADYKSRDDNVQLPIRGRIKTSRVRSMPKQRSRD